MSHQETPLSDQEIPPEVPENAIRARAIYRAGVPRKQILAETKLTVSQLYHWLAGGPLRKDGKGRLLPEIELRCPRGRKVTPGERKAVIQRIVRISMQQMDAIRTSETTALERERDARTLAMIARTLAELTAIDERNRQMKRRKTSRENDQWPIAEQCKPRSDAELEQSLVRKLQAVIAEQNSDLPEAS